MPFAFELGQQVQVPHNDAGPIPGLIVGRQEFAEHLNRPNLYQVEVTYWDGLITGAWPETALLPAQESTNG